MGPHCFDKVAIKNKKEMLIAEVKTKAARLYYPDTGFNLRNYREYQAIKEKYNVPIFVFFVDEKKRRVYGNWLAKKESPLDNK